MRLFIDTGRLSSSAPGRLGMADDRRNTMFTADALGLDFLNSGLTMDGAVDWLGSGEGLLTWLEQARLVPMEAAHILRVSAFPGELDAVAAQARVLREWFRGFVLAHKGKPLTLDVLEELKPLNHVLERDEGFGSIGTRSLHVHDHPQDQTHVAALELHVHRR